MLPKIVHPVTEVIIPSTSQTIKIRPMVTKEDKLLLFAKEDSNPSAAILQAIKQIVTNCIVTEGVDVDSLTIYDLELLFIKIRIVSVSNMVKASYTDNEDEQVYDFEVNLEEVQIKNPILPPNVVEVYPGTELVLQSPRASLYSDQEFFNATDKTIADIFIKSVIRSVVTSEIETPDQSKGSVQPFSGTPEEVQEFIDNLPIKTREGIIDFLEKQPTIYHRIEYVNKKGTARSIEFKTLNDFFIFV